MSALVPAAQAELGGGFKPLYVDHGGERPRGGERVAVQWCAKCGNRRLFLGGPHAPHLVSRDGALVLVDCKGERIE